ncbi:hypothetical protein KUCAC02_030667, partial [Chaenocephalus aceratus]
QQEESSDTLDITLETEAWFICSQIKDGVGVGTHRECHEETEKESAVNTSCSPTERQGKRHSPSPFVALLE